MREVRKFILDRFVAHLTNGFAAYCDQCGIEKTEESLLTYMIDQDLIKGAEISRYTVQKEFDVLCKSPVLSKTEAVFFLAQKFGIGERTVWAILKTKNNPVAKK